MLCSRFLKLCLPLLILGGCGRVNSYQEPPPPEVSVTSPVERSVTEYLNFSGMTQPSQSVEIRARVRGFLKERNFVEGGEVHKGQLLIVIDEEPFQIQHEAAKVRLKEMDAALEKAVSSKERDIAAAQIKLSESQLQLARQDETRVRSLFQRNVATESDMEQASARLRKAEAELESAKANYDHQVATYDTTILSCRAQTESARIAVESAALELSYCRVSSPIDGRISRIYFDVGNLVGDSQSTVLATMMTMSPLFAYGSVSESDYLKTPALASFNPAATDQETPVELGKVDQTGYPIHGRVDYLDPAIDAATGTIRIRCLFTNAERQLLPGMFVRLRIPVTQRDKALLVPERALGTDQSGTYVLVVGSDGKVEYRPVKTGVAMGELRVVEGTLSVTDQVIYEGLLRARPGIKVTPVVKDLPQSKDVAQKPQ